MSDVLCRSDYSPLHCIQYYNIYVSNVDSAWTHDAKVVETVFSKYTILSKSPNNNT